MSLNLISLDFRNLEHKYLGLEDHLKKSDKAERCEAANRIFVSCLADCKIKEHASDFSLPDKADFDICADALPDTYRLKKCMEFLKELSSTEKKSKGLRPWWMSASSHNAGLLAPDAVLLFSENLHACKFFEILLANMVSGDSAERLIEVGEFFDDAAANGWAVLFKQEN